MFDFFGGRHKPLLDSDIQSAANMISVDPAVIASVVNVEGGGKAFMGDGRMVMLYEAHIFGRLTRHKFDGVRDPHGKPISARAWDRSLYGAAGDWQYTRLDTAMKCDEDAALQAASYGAFQILGINFKAAGYADIREMLTAWKDSAGEQLDGFVAFIKNNHLDDELQNQDWKDFAKGYNGPQYYKNNYDEKLASAYAKMAAQWAASKMQAQDDEPQIDKHASLSRSVVAQVQAALNVVLDIRPLKIDGWMGPRTETAIANFERKYGLPATGKPDAMFLATLFSASKNHPDIKSN